jgi:hypothetical protein
VNVKLDNISTEPDQAEQSPQNVHASSSMKSRVQVAFGYPIVCGGLIAASAALLILGGLFFGIGARGTGFETAPMTTMEKCTSDTLTQLRLEQPPDAKVLRQLVEHCYSMIHSQGVLNDFSIRKLNYVQQYQANGILLWMVVFITVAGVLIAGVQIAASYQLASKNKASIVQRDEITVKLDQIVLKSSVAGISILLLSFAFFLVFVRYVYQFEDRRPGEPNFRLTEPALPPGGLGPPPRSPP